MARLDKPKTGQWELVICLAAPLLLILVISLSGWYFSRRMQRDVRDRTEVLKQIPAMEQQVREIRRMIATFVVADGATDKAAELALTVGRATKKSGFVIQSSTVDKQPGGEADLWMDYRVAIRGEGTLKTVIGVTDSLELSEHRFRTIQLNWKLKQLAPELIGDVDCTLMVRTLRNKPAPGGNVVTPAQLAERAATLTVLSQSVSAWIDAKQAPLDLKSFDDRNPFVEAEASKGEVDQSLSFRLTGIVHEINRPMIMTDKGVYGVGDEVDGFTVEAISNDAVTVIGRSGIRQIVNLYRGGGGP